MHVKSLNKLLEEKKIIVFTKSMKETMIESCASYSIDNGTSYKEYEKKCTAMGNIENKDRMQIENVRKMIILHTRIK